MAKASDRFSLPRVPTGVPALDDTLGGGLPKGSVVFVAGLPGTGKTILCQQAMWTNALQGETIVYLSTLSEPMVKMLRFAQTFSFFRPELIGEGIIYGDLGSVLLQDGPGPVIETLERFVREHRPDLLVIDSFKAMREGFEGRVDFRRFASEVLQRLNTWEVTTLLVGEYNEHDIREEAEFSIADGIIYLYGTEEAQHQKRMLRIMKMRGTDFFGGEHLFEITSEGIALYPRLSPAIVGEYKFTGGRVRSVITGLDEMLGGGIFESTSTLIAGMTGSGKTLTALSFLVSNVEKQPGLLVTMEESPLQIVRNSDAFGWGVEELMAKGMLEIRHVSPSELDIDRHAMEIKERAEQLGAKLVVIDSISALETSAPSGEKYRSYLWAINDHFKRTGVTTIMTAESARLFEAQEFAPQHVSLFADNIILLRSIEVEGENKRVISVPKMRGSQHDRVARELVVDPPQITVGPAFTQVGSEDRTGDG